MDPAEALVAFDAPYALAVAAGLVAAVNPCGFALLPAYVSFLVLDRPDSGVPGGLRDRGSGGRLAAVGRALALTGAVTVGFVAVFGLFGLLAAPAADLVARHLPWFSVVVGLTLAGLGGWLLAGRDLPVLAPKPTRGPAVGRRLGSMVVFGASYAVASLGCTVGPFLVVVVSTFRTGSAVDGVGLFVAYALGMALTVGAVALAVALAKVSFVRGLRRLGPVAGRVGGALLVASGLYVAWYGWYELRVFAGGDPADPVVDAAARIQGVLSGWLDALGWGGAVVAFAALLLATVTASILLRRRPS
jgi:cytochrome c biogenesis protein CcdA